MLVELDDRTLPGLSVNLIPLSDPLKIVRAENVILEESIVSSKRSVTVLLLRLMSQL